MNATLDGQPLISAGQHRRIFKRLLAKENACTDKEDTKVPETSGDQVGPGANVSAGGVEVRT